MTDTEAPVLWPPDAKSQLVGKDPDAGKDWRQEEKGTTENEMVGWQHQIDGHEFEQAQGVGDGVTKSQTWLTELNWTELICANRVKNKFVCYMFSETSQRYSFKFK